MTLWTRRAMLRQGLSVAAAAMAGRPVLKALAHTPPPFEMPAFEAPTFPDRSFSIVDFGARPGGEESNTLAIRRAIAACAEAGGGRVLVPTGVWLTGPIHLKSRVDLHLADGAELRFSPRFDDYLPVVYIQRGGVRCYNYSPLIYAHQCETIAVTGRGTLNGQGQAWWPWKKRQPGMTRLFHAPANGIPVQERVFGTEADGVRPPFIQPIDCRNVLLEGFTMINGPSWNIHPVYCENVTVRKVSVTTLGPNNDGIDPDSCRNVLIEDCFLDTGDDCICLKAGRNEDAWEVGKPLENVLIRRCRTKRGHGGVVIGSEMSAGVRNVFVHDCHFAGTQRGIRIKSLPGRGGFIENIHFQDITMDEIGSEAIVLTLRYPGEVRDADGAALPRLRNMHFRNITCNKAKVGIAMIGLDNCPIEDISLADVNIAAETGVRCEHVERIRLSRVDVKPARSPVLRFIDSRDVTMEQMRAPAGTKVFLELQGSRTANFRLRDVDLAAAEQSIRTGEDVPAGAIETMPTASAVDG